jgi:hypothetical protein
MPLRFPASCPMSHLSLEIGPAFWYAGGGVIALGPWAYRDASRARPSPAGAIARILRTFGSLPSLIPSGCSRPWETRNQEPCTLRQPRLLRARLCLSIVPPSLLSVSSVANPLGSPVRPKISRPPKVVADRNGSELETMQNRP